MGQIRHILKGLLQPPRWAIFLLPLLSFAALTAVFAWQCNENALAYPVYSLSAYSLALWIAAAWRLTRRARSAIMDSRRMQRLADAPFLKRYRRDLAFRGSVHLCLGAAVSFIYAILRIVIGICYTSVWSVSLAVYYLVLGGLRAYLLAGYRRRCPAREARCYHTVAWLLFLLNLPMGGMIVQMVLANFGFSYPGHLIYLSAAYAFYAMAMSVCNLVKFRRIGSPILSAAKVLNFVSAMMSILSLQTAMISRFSRNGAAFRQRMNALTGGSVYAAVILIAVFMLLHAKKEKEEKCLESIRKPVFCHRCQNGRGASDAARKKGSPLHHR